MNITASSFPTPDLIKTTNNPALWDQQSAFAKLQAAAANDSLKELNFDLNRIASQEEAYARLIGRPPDDEKTRTRNLRAAHFAELYQNLAKWRWEVARGAGGEDWMRYEYGHPIHADRITDLFGPGLRSEGCTFDTAMNSFTAGVETPASRLSARIGSIIEARFATEAPDAEVLQNRVTLPSGQVVNGNELLRGSAASMARFRSVQAVPELYVTRTGEQDDRRRLQREAFELLADLEGRLAAGETDLFADPGAQHAFAQAAYFLYQGPEYRRGGDAIIRIVLVTAHARVFDEALRLRQDIDVMAYAADQEAFCEYFGRTQSIVTTAARQTAVQATAAVRPQDRGQQMQRG